MADTLSRLLLAIQKVVEQEKAIDAVKAKVDNAVDHAKLELQKIEDVKASFEATMARDKPMLEARRAELSRMIGGMQLFDESVLAEVKLETDLTISEACPAEPKPALLAESKSKFMTKSPVCAIQPVKTSSNPPTKKRKRLSTGPGGVLSEDGKVMGEDEIKALLDSAKDYQKSEYAPTIVKAPDGNWHELRCGICHGNYSTLTRSFLKGLPAFQIHLKRSHDSNDPAGWAEAFKLCDYRAVPDDEMVEMMRKGKSGMPHIDRVDVQHDKKNTALDKPIKLIPVAVDQLDQNFDNNGTVTQPDKTLESIDATPQLEKSFDSVDEYLLDTAASGEEDESGSGKDDNTSNEDKNEDKDPEVKDAD